MKNKRCSEKQIIAVLKEAEACAKMGKLRLCEDHGNSKTVDSLITDWVGLGRQFVLFTLAGVFGTLAHYVLLVILVELFGIEAVIASMAGALLGAIINYALNYRFTFNSRASHRVAVPKFLGVATVGFLINMVLMWVAVNLTDLHYLVGQVITTSLVLLWNFIGNRFWTFGEKQNGATR